MSYSVTMKRQGRDTGQAGHEATVRYADVRGGTGGLLAQAVVLRASALPDPPPDEIHITVDWAEVAARPGRRQRGCGPRRPIRARRWARAPGGGSPKRATASRWSRAEYRASKNPPEWLEQFVGRTGIVLWTTADGAMLDLDGETAWFSYEELVPKD